MHVGPRLAFGRHPVDRACGNSVDQNDAFVTGPHIRQILLHHERLWKRLFEHFQQRYQVLVRACQPEHAGTAIAVKRLQNDIADLLPEGPYIIAIPRNQRFRH